MIVLKADSELKMTFERLIKTMHANVNWTGLFVALDNYLILQGEVRSLFFHFDSRKVAENIVDLPIKEDEIKDTDEAAVRDVINMILYAFGKWGTIQGLRVEKNTEQLNTLFGHVLAGIYIEPEYTTQYFRFYHAGKRITYEDVIQAALEAKEAVQKEAVRYGEWSYAGDVSCVHEGGGDWYQDEKQVRLVFYPAVCKKCGISDTECKVEERFIHIGDRKKIQYIL